MITNKSAMRVFLLAILIPIVIMGLALFLTSFTKPDQTAAILRISGLKPIATGSILDQEKKAMIISEGYGFPISSDGLLLTVAHLVEDEEARYFFKEQEQEEEITLVAIDSKKDLALMKMNTPNKTSFFPIRHSKDDITLGQKIFTFQADKKVTGVVTATQRSIQAAGTFIKKDLNGLLELNVSLTEGDSGLPIFSTKGDVIGMVVAIDSQNPETAFAIPIKTLQEFFGKTERPL